MFTYALKNLKSLFTRQRLLAFLLILNIIASAFVLCFSYGVYRNYDEIQDREAITSDIEAVNIYARSDSFKSTLPISDNSSDGVFTNEITPQMFIDLLHALPDSLNESIAGVDAEFWVQSPISCMENGSTGDLFYSDDADQFWWPINCSFKLTGGKIVDANDEKYFTYDQYNNGERVAVVSNILYASHPDNQSSGSSFSAHIKGSRTAAVCRLLPSGTISVLFGDERYDIVRSFQYYEVSDTAVYGVKIPVTALPENAVITVDSAASRYEDDPPETLLFTIRFKGYATDKQLEVIEEKLTEVMGENVHLEHLPFMMAREADYFNTVIVLALFIGIIASVNMAILYRYILEKRSSDLAVFRICGCTQETAIASYLIECLIITAPVFALSQLMYHILFRPLLAEIFPYTKNVYNAEFYIMIFCLYVALSAFIMYKMIKSTVNKQSLAALKNSKRSTNRFGFMKALEIAQLATIVSLLVIVVSTVTSRYESFQPFEKYLSRKGYMVISVDSATNANEFESLTNGADKITSHQIGVSYFEEEEEKFTNFEVLAYSDEFIDLYDPLIIAGAWLDDIDETYENTGYIPAIVTENMENYSVGDILPDDLEGEYNTNGGAVKYKIVGMVGYQSRILSYIPTNFVVDDEDTSFVLSDYELNDYQAMFNMFEPINERYPFLLTRASDIYACYGSYGPVRGAQLVFCDDMTDDEYKAVGEKLSDHDGFNVAELSEIYDSSKLHIYQQMYSLLPTAICIFILTLISAISISAIYTKRQLRNYAIFYICGARWSRCALMSFKSGVMTCIAASAVGAVGLMFGNTFLFGDTVISFGPWHLAVCAGVIVLYLILSMIMPLSIIGSAQPREVLKEE